MLQAGMRFWLAEAPRLTTAFPRERSFFFYLGRRAAHGLDKSKLVRPQLTSASSEHLAVQEATEVYPLT